MRHRKAGLKLNRTSSHRKAMFRNMVTSLFKYERIHTTDAKAKELRRWADHLITLAKQGDLHARRLALSIIREKNIVHKLFDEASDRFGAISGGYTRVVKSGRRPGDAAPISIIELISPEKSKEKKTKKKTKSAEKGKKQVAEEQKASDSKKGKPDKKTEKKKRMPDTSGTKSESDDSSATSTKAVTGKGNTVVKPKPEVDEENTKQKE
ncbi:MAG: 50S ribosomal protein L17 [Desulfobacter sp.]|jgi:large subunit ribosomal protein L17|nr:50S ribosomal protein L17 [Desulfobacter sp.]|tara:strand:+ start:14519 stop:15145 length:627 start_codon:yes stop_codon:yes gene_type:complete